jgi:hypothetical protein
VDRVDEVRAFDELLGGFGDVLGVCTQVVLRPQPEPQHIGDEV